jgi:hypothetical protein
VTAPAIGDDLIKHVVRYRAWLPACQQRIAERRTNYGPKAPLRYFTFSGGEPLDVILLHSESLLPAPHEHGFTSVCFFDRHGADTTATSRRIPGAISFSGSFVETMLATTYPTVADLRSDEANEYDNLLLGHKRFKEYFPFDVVNFDLEEVLFKPGEPAPGRLLEALRMMFSWQREHLEGINGIPGFSLMLTLKAPMQTNVTDEARTLLRNTLDRNIELFPQLADILSERDGITDVVTLEADRWDRAFELGMPKVILAALQDARWTVDPDAGIRILRRAGPAAEPQLPLYHIICDVIPLGDDTDANLLDYGRVVRRLFEQPPDDIEASAVTPAVRNSLARVMEVQARILGHQPNW